MAAKLKRALWWELLAVLVIFLLALAVRVYRLDELPPGLFNDEAAYGLDALSVLDGARPVFFPRNTGREPLFPYLQAGMLALLGPSPFALRLTAAIIGALAVPAAYWLVRELFWRSPLGARRLALWSALFMAFGYWHISLSRIGFRANLLPLLAAVTFALFWRAWRTLEGGGRFPWLWSILTGLALGVTLYTYTAGRFLPILLALTVLAAAIHPALDRRMRVRMLWFAAVVALTSAVVFAPLGWYFVQHPDQFGGRAASVSFLSERYSEGHPLLTFGATAGKLALMFLTLGDPNLRHNPGQQPVFDLLLGLWFYAGLAVCLFKFRKLPYLFLLLWVLLLALPALLSPESAPHSLRAIGMIPAVYVLPVVAMGSAAAALRPRVAARWRAWLLWLPLPFLLWSGVWSLQGYFGAWRDIGGFTGVFMSNYGELADRMVAAGRDPGDQGVWIMPLSPNYFLIEPEFYAMDFALAQRANFAGISVDPRVAGEQLAAALAGKQAAQLVRAQNSDRFPEAGYILDDPKHLIKYLLDKYGVPVAARDEEVVGMPYLVYRLPAQADYAVFGAEEQASVAFDDKVRLTGLSYGRTAQARSGVDVDEPAVPSGEPLWVALRWEATAPVDVDLKTSLLLRDAAGHVAGQVDDLLVGDRYPVARVWEAGETTASYHIVPTLGGVAPGRYDLVLRVYEDQTARPYPVLDAGGTPLGTDAVIGSVEIIPGVTEAAIAPQQVLDPPVALAPETALLGYDLPVTLTAAGSVLPLTLYWRATAAPPVDYGVNLQLRDSAGRVVAEQTRPAGGEAFPTRRWAPGATVRDWQDLSLAGDLPDGGYSLWLALVDGSTRLREVSLGEITVAGRPHVYTLPPLAQPVGVTFGGIVALEGLETALPASIRGGDTIVLPLAWQVLAPTPRPLVRFVHLLGADGRPVAQVDSVPCAGECPSPTWVEGEVLRDAVTLTVPAESAPGPYTLAVGLYDAETLQRLPAVGADGQVLANDLAPLGALTVDP